MREAYRVPGVRHAGGLPPRLHIGQEHGRREGLPCVHELRQADGGARGRRRVRLHLLKVAEIDGAKPLRQGVLNTDGVLVAPPY